MDTTSYIAYIEEEITNNGQSQLIICLLQNFGDQEGKRRRETPRPFSGLQVSDTIIREKTNKKINMGKVHHHSHDLVPPVALCSTPLYYFSSAI